jgi:hypothetical protein
MATTHPGSTSRPQVLVYDRLEGAIYPGVAQNVDTVKFAAALQQLMQACGWSLDAYSANPWTQSHNVMGLFVSQLLALTQQAPTTPQAFDIDLAYRNFVGNYTNGVPGLNPVYTEGWNGGNLEWYFYSPTYNANGPTFFFGRVGSATVYIAQKAPTAIGTPMSSLYEIMSNPVNDYTGVQLQITPVIFEAVAMGQFFDALSTARSSFLTNNTNYFNTLNA